MSNEEMTDHADLIARLEAATEGSRGLDYRIAEASGWLYRGDEEFKEYGCNWFAPGISKGWQLPLFSTSLDAKLPGEDICEITRLSLNPLRWEAWQFGMEFCGTAHTEALARRIAALKAMKARSA